MRRSSSESHMSLRTSSWVSSMQIPVFIYPHLKYGPGGAICLKYMRKASKLLPNLLDEITSIVSYKSQMQSAHIVSGLFGNIPVFASPNITFPGIKDLLNAASMACPTSTPPTLVVLGHMQYSMHLDS